MSADPKEIRALRRKAEKALTGVPEKPALMSETALKGPVHEQLSVHGIEPEMQNEDLRSSPEGPGSSRSEHTDPYDSAPVGCLTFDKAGLVSGANLAACALLGIERSLLVKKPFALLIHPEYRDVFSAHRQKALEASAAQTCRLVLKRKDGTFFDARLESTGVGSDGAAVIRTVLTDISERGRTEKEPDAAHKDPQKKVRERTSHLWAGTAERTQAEEALRDSEEDYRFLFDNMSSGYAYCKMLFDENGPKDFTYLKVNRAFGALTGLKNVTGKNVSEVIPGIRRSDPELFETFGRVALTGTPERFETYVKALEMWFSVSVYSPRREYFVAVFDVITESKENEAEKERLIAELSAERARWRATVENMPDPLTVCDAEGRAIYMNRAYEKLVERPIAKDLAEEAHPDYYQLYRPDGTRFPAAELPLQKAARTGVEVRDVELVQRSAGGREFTAIFSAAPLRDADGKVTGAVAVGHDITEQRRVERVLKKTLDELEALVADRTRELQHAYDRLKEEVAEREQIEARLRQAQKMEALGTLAGGIAHDFNNILAAMIGFAEMAKERAPKGSRQEYRLQKVTEAGLRGRDLVRQMLTFSRKSDREKEPLQLGGLLKEAMKLLRASIPSTIETRVTIDGKSGFVLADPTGMEQVIMNLVSNAAHAMREKGGVLDVELSDHNVPLLNESEGMKPGPYLKLTVRDTGVGIPAGVIDRIFDPFFTTKGPGEGTGLGLSVVHGIVERHDGYVRVESDPEKGSAFTVYLPKLAGPPQTKTDGEEPVPTGHERVLFIDDEEALAEMGREMLTGLGYRVESKTRSGEALAVLRSDPSRFDLVITDQTMPDMAGMDLAREIIALRADMPVILCTGFSHTANEESAKAAGIRAFVMKPLTKKEIARTIRRVLEK